MQHSKWYLAWCSGFDIVSGDRAICLVAELARSFARSTYLKDKSIINDEITLRSKGGS